MIEILVSHSLRTWIKDNLYILKLYLQWLLVLILSSTELVVWLAAWENCKGGASHLSLMNTSALQLRKLELQIRGLWNCLMFLAWSICQCHFHVPIDKTTCIGLISLEGFKNQWILNSIFFLSYGRECRSLLCNKLGKGDEFLECNSAAKE